jgi:hypothetical protein
MAEDERTCLQIVRALAKVRALPAPANNFTSRREAVAGTLSRLVDGKPGLTVSPACKVLRNGFAGGYHFKRVKVTGDERYHDQPNKSEYSDVHDALHYVLSGGGEVRAVTAPRSALPARR